MLSWPAAGDIPTLEVLAATSPSTRSSPNLKVRVISVVDLMRLEPHKANTLTAFPIESSMFYLPPTSLLFLLITDTRGSFIA